MCGPEIGQLRQVIVHRPGLELSRLTPRNVGELLREREVIPRLGLVADESPDEARTAVQAAAGELVQAGVKAHAGVRDTIFGHAAREIVDDAKEHEVGVIVMGCRAGVTWPGSSWAVPRTR
jgi:nucleotide-binding universal stress UspA family protein